MGLVRFGAEVSGLSFKVKVCDCVLHGRSPEICMYIHTYIYIYMCIYIYTHI